MNQAQLDSLVQEAIRLKNLNRFDLDKFLFKEQLDFVRDPARFTTAVCSVRSGKTTSCAADLIDTALKMKGVICLYITLVRASAKRIVWPELHNIAKQFHLDCSFNESELSVKFTNGSIIYCSGANTAVEIERFRGLSNVAVVYIDESQAFRKHIKELVEDVIVKRLYDLNGRCRLIGTPGPIPGGYFYECSTSSQWSHHAWTLHANPHIERKSGLTVDALIAQDMARKGVTIDDPSIQRECFGRWVLDENSLLLNYSADKNHFDTLPKGVYNFLLGIDLGFDDSDSLSVLAYTDTSPATYLVEEVITAKQTIDALMEQIARITKNYSITKIVADTGGLGKKIVESLIARYPFPIEPAEKQDKMGNYALLNNALRNGTFKARKDSQFAQDCNLLERDKEKSTPERLVVRGHSDAIDSALYAFKFSPAYYYVLPKPIPKIGTDEYSKLEEEKHIESIMEQMKRERDIKEGRSQFGNWHKDQRGIPDWNKW